MAICSWLLWLAPWRKFHVWHATNSYMSHKDKCVLISNSCISNKLTSFCVAPLEVPKEIVLVCIWEVAHLHYWIELVMQRPLTPNPILFLLPGRPWCIINPFTHLVSFESVSCFFWTSQTRNIKQFAEKTIGISVLKHITLFCFGATLMWKQVTFKSMVVNPSHDCIDSNRAWKSACGMVCAHWVHSDDRGPRWL